MPELLHSAHLQAVIYREAAELPVVVLIILLALLIVLVLLIPWFGFPKQC